MSLANYMYAASIELGSGLVVAKENASLRLPANEDGMRGLHNFLLYALVIYLTNSVCQSQKSNLLSEDRIVCCFFLTKINSNRP